MNYQTLIQDLEIASAKEEKSTTQKVLDTLIKIFRQLEEREIDINTINQHTTAIHNELKSDALSYGQISKLQTGLTQALLKEHGLSTKGYYQNLWMVLGMSMFGIPLGLIFGLTLGSFAFFALGLPIGMPIGIAIGMQKEKEAQNAGTVLEV
ncbi:hypothetical protein [Roseivirga misakiensis]|uniref:Uncharacterized protein n=1 Tax=Roseivirga misakiensis TaxID=1563681 RepID=A0A1E5T6J1_9BACT|nr:hypothetical protein [Roseivirga misakiensis]OEK07014.1 hypothetical protein BFP71_04970 [Roseivirga misakiensis]